MTERARRLLLNHARELLGLLDRCDPINDAALVARVEKRLGEIDAHLGD
jgi:hypothetical protein